MKEFKINNFFSLRLENGKTIIYVKGKQFNQCKQLVLNIKVKEVSDFDEIESIDEAIEVLNVQERVEEISITSETEFWAHCSNLQVWDEYNYDTNLIHSNLAFPLLKELVKAGDQKAQRIFSEEIAKRIEKNYFPVIQYLINEGFLDYLNNSQFLSLLKSSYIDIPQLIEKYNESERSHEYSFKIYKLFERLKNLPIKIYHEILMELYKKGHIPTTIYLNEMNYDLEIKRKNYYFCILEQNDARTMLELEKSLKLNFWLDYSVTGEIEAGITVENRRVVEMNICKEEISEFPNYILNLRKLRKLLLYCGIKEVPREIDRLKNLNVLENVIED